MDSGDIPVGVMEQASQQFSLDQGQYHAEHKQSQGQAEVAVHGGIRDIRVDQKLDKIKIEYQNQHEHAQDDFTKMQDALVLYDRKFLHSEETILKMPAFMRAPKQDDY